LGKKIANETTVEAESELEENASFVEGLMANIRASQVRDINCYSFSLLLGARRDGSTGRCDTIQFPK
jgi:hypothetical protein